MTSSNYYKSNVVKYFMDNCKFDINKALRTSWTFSVRRASAGVLGLYMYIEIGWGVCACVSAFVYVCLCVCVFSI